MDKTISIIVPTYNERDNVTTLVREISQVLSGVEFEIVFVETPLQLHVILTDISLIFLSPLIHIQ